MIETHPAAARYLARLRAALASVPAAERDEIVGEIAQHVNDAAAAGRSIDAVLQALGPADTLARAYAVELALNAPPALGRVDRALTIVGLVTIASLPSFLVVVILGAFGLAFTAAGVAVFAAGIAALIDPALVPDLTVPRWVCLVVGLPLAAVGIAAFFAVYYYVRGLARLTQQTLKRVRQRA